MKTLNGGATLDLSPPCAGTLTQILIEWRNQRVPLDEYMERRYASHPEGWRGAKRMSLLLRIKHVEAVLAQLGYEVAEPTV